jgi:hypothetical protein
MFPDTPKERQKTIEWDAFVSAVDEVSSTTSNGGGSIVLSVDRSNAGKIIFHRPHPEPKIDPIMLQLMGRRLNKWFRWHRELFALAGK